jgi:Protein of unknown function (DUF4058)
MPIHDWSRVDANVYHDFHQTWSISIRNALNAGLLPSGYSALVEQHAAGLVPDVLAVERRPRRNRPSEPSGGAVTTTPPKTRYATQTKEETLAARANRIVVRHRLGEVVCVIEILSPGNKSSRPGFKSFIDKTVAFLRAGVNLLVVDPFPPGPRDPQGIHKALWDEIEEEPYELPPDKRLTLAAYVAADLTVGSPTKAYVNPVAVGDVLPDMPVYLDRLSYVPAPLESTYQTAWATCPADMRELVETGRLSDED